MRDKYAKNRGGWCATHNPRRGEEHHNSVLDPTTANQILEQYKPRITSLNKLAARF